MLKVPLRWLRLAIRASSKTFHLLFVTRKVPMEARFPKNVQTAISEVLLCVTKTVRQTTASLVESAMSSVEVGMLTMEHPVTNP